MRYGHFKSQIGLSLTLLELYILRNLLAFSLLYRVLSLKYPPFKEILSLSSGTVHYLCRIHVEWNGEFLLETFLKISGLLKCHLYLYDDTNEPLMMMMIYSNTFTTTTTMWQLVHRYVRGDDNTNSTAHQIQKIKGQ